MGREMIMLYKLLQWFPLVRKQKQSYNIWITIPTQLIGSQRKKVEKRCKDAARPLQEIIKLKKLY